MIRILIINLFSFFAITSLLNAEELEKNSIVKRLQEGQVCMGMFFEGQFSDIISNQIKTTHFYNMYHSKAIDIIRKPMDLVLKELKKDKQKISKKELKEIMSFSEKGKKIVYEYLSKDKFNLGEANMVPLFEEGGSNKTGLIAKANTEPIEMTDCKKKFLMDEDNLLTFGIMGTKVKKEYIKEIANKYLYGF